jgi:hypothetical protein
VYVGNALSENILVGIGVIADWAVVRFPIKSEYFVGITAGTCILERIFSKQSQLDKRQVWCRPCTTLAYS